MFEQGSGQTAMPKTRRTRWSGDRACAHVVCPHEHTHTQSTSKFEPNCILTMPLHCTTVTPHSHKHTLSTPLQHNELWHTHMHALMHLQDNTRHRKTHAHTPTLLQYQTYTHHSVTKELEAVERGMRGPLAPVRKTASIQNQWSKNRQPWVWEPPTAQGSADHAHLTYNPELMFSKFYRSIETKQLLLKAISAM